MTEKVVLTIITVVAAGILGSLAYTAYWNATHTCISGHTVTHWPHGVSGNEKTEYVCDEYKEAQ